MDKTRIFDIVEKGKNKEIISAVRNALEEGAEPTTLINIMIDAMKVVGDDFQTGKILISDMLSAAMTMKKGISFLTPLIEGNGAEHIGKIIIGMAPGDLHDIGKGLVSIMLESIGFEVIDLGIDVAPESFAEAIKENPDCKLLAISATLDSSVKRAKFVIEYLEKVDLRKNIKIMAGGTAITESIAKEIGADEFAPTATLTAVIAKNLFDGLRESSKDS